MYKNENEPSSLTIGLYTCTQKNVAVTKYAWLSIQQAHRLSKHTSSQQDTQRWTTKLITARSTQIFYTTTWPHKMPHINSLL